MMNKEVCKTFAEEIKAGRKARKMSMEALAKETGCARSTINYIEKGQRNPKSDLRQRLLKVLEPPERKTPEKKPETRESNPVRSYFLKAEELEYYRNLPRQYVSVKRAFDITEG